MKDPNYQLALEFEGKIWKEVVNKSPSKHLPYAWGAIFYVFGLCIDRNFHNPKEVKRIVVPSQTGTGKTLAASFYASKLPKGTGMLIVTFLKDEVDRIKDDINNWSGDERAIAHHSGVRGDDKYNRSEFKNHQILVTTHSELKLSSDKFNKDGKESRIEQLYSYMDGQRGLIVIDEAMDNIFQSSFNYIEVQTVLGKINSLPKYAKSGFEKDAEALESLIGLLNQTEIDRQTNEINISASGLYTDIPGIRKILSKHDFSFKGLNKLFNDDSMKDYDVTYDGNTKTVLLNILNNIYAVMNSNWGYYLIDHHTNLIELRTARSAMITEMSSVILDATASINYYYRLQPGTMLYKAIPKDIRNYKNTTLFIAEKQITGREGLCNLSNDHLDVIANEIDKNIFKNNKVAIFTHICLEDKLQNKYKDQLEGVQLGHFGKLTGLNNYSDCNTLYLLGLPYKPESYYTDLHALSKAGISCFDNNKETKNDRDKIKTTTLSAEVVQTINRVSCRNIIDSEGNCPITTIHMLLPIDKTISKSILDSIQEQMPGIVIKRWDFVLKTSKKPGPKRKYDEPFLKELPKDYNESILFSIIANKLGMPETTKDKFRKRLQDPNDPLKIEVMEASVAFVKNKKSGLWMLTKEA